MTINSKELFSRFCLGKIILEISKEFPNISTILKQHSVGTVYELGLARAGREEMLRLCFAIKHSNNRHDHWPFALNAEENRLLEDASRRGCAIFIFLVTYTRGVACLGRSDYETIKHTGGALFNVSKKIDQRSYRVHVPRTKKYINVPQNAFPNEVIKLIRRLIRKSQRSGSH